MRYVFAIGVVAALGLMVLVLITWESVQDPMATTRSLSKLEIRCGDEKNPPCVSYVDGWLECLDRFVLSSSSEVYLDFEFVHLNVFDDSERPLEFILSNSITTSTDTGQKRLAGFEECRLQLKRLIEEHGESKVMESLKVILPRGEFEHTFNLRDNSKLDKFVNCYRARLKNARADKGVRHFYERP